MVGRSSGWRRLVRSGDGFHDRATGATLFSLAKLMAAVYLTCLFVIIVRAPSLRPVVSVSGSSFATSRKKSWLCSGRPLRTALPRRCQARHSRTRRSVVGLVDPDRLFSISMAPIMTIAVALCAGAGRASPMGALMLLGVLMLTSGAPLPSPGGLPRCSDARVHFHARRSRLTLLIGVDRFMSRHAITNLINGVATMVVARWRAPRSSASLADSGCRSRS
jgi:Na+/H+-dicarboxylate symporter